MVDAACCTIRVARGFGRRVIAWQYSANADESGATSAPRFLAPDLDPASGELELPPDEVTAPHARPASRRRRVVAVFDGRGRSSSHASAARGRHVRWRCWSRSSRRLKPARPVHAGAAVLKGDAMDDIVRDATMMGAAAIQPSCSARRGQAGVALRPELGDAGGGSRSRRQSSHAARLCLMCARPLPFGRSLAGAHGALPLMFVEPAAARATRSLRSPLRHDASGIVRCSSSGRRADGRRRARAARTAPAPCRSRSAPHPARRRRADGGRWPSSDCCGSEVRFRWRR